MDASDSASADRTQPGRATFGLSPQTSAALLDGDEFFRELVNSLPAAIYTTDAAGRITYFNEAAAALWGCRPALGHSEWCGSWKLYWPDGRVLPHSECPMAIAVKENRPVRGMEAVAERPDGIRVPFIPFPTPIYDSSGALIGAVNMLVDITDRKRAEEAAQRLAAIVESSDDAILSKDLDGTITSWNKGAERLFGYMAEEAIGKFVTILIPPECLDEETAIIERIRRGERIEHYESVRQRKHGGLVDVSLTISPITNNQGKIVGASSIARDISERKRTDAHIANLAREAEHRAKNILATVQATVRLSRAGTADELKKAIQGRIGALAKVHALFVQSRWMGADLRTLAMQELSPYRGEIESRVQIDGPSMSLDPNTAQAVAVSLHELATNAAKYGALSTPGGHVRVAWSLAEDRRLVLLWTETGGPTVKPPTKHGFGTRVLESIVEGQLGGELQLNWRAEGLACEISFPTLT